MAKRQPDGFESIDLGKLDTVSGGRGAARSSAAVKANQNDPMMTMLTSIEQSLASLSSQPSPMQMMLQMFEMMHGINPNMAPATAARQQNGPLVASTQGAWKSKK